MLHGVEVILLPTHHSTANPSAVVLEMLKHEFGCKCFSGLIIDDDFCLVRIQAECSRRGVFQAVEEESDWASMVHVRELYLMEVAKEAWVNMAIV